MPSVPIGEIRLIVHVGLMLFLGLLVGEVLARIRIPRVTGYLLAGLLMGPSVSGTIQWLELRKFDLIAQLALGVIMFSIGGEFRAARIRHYGKKLFTVTAVQMLLTWVSVGLLVWLFSRNWILATLTGFIAMETAPATTLVVVKEYESEGPFTSNLVGLVGINNFFCLVLFPFLLVVLLQSERGLLFSFYEIAKAMVLGLGGGCLLSLLEERVYSPKQQLLLAFAAIALVVGLAYAWGGSGPLATLVMGMAKINTSARGAAIFKVIDASAYPFYVLFFVIAGANLHLETLALVGMLGVAYIAARTFGKIAGAALGAGFADLSKDWKKYLGPAMLPHAGVAIGLAMLLGQFDAPAARSAQAIVLGSIVLFEFVGPVLVRHSLVQCGEVKLVSLLPRLPGGSLADIFERMEGQVRSSLGLTPRPLQGRAAGPLRVKHVMRRNVETIPDNARLDELMKIFSRAHYDVLPVVDKEGAYLGNISFVRIRDVIFDKAVADLVIARDLLDDVLVYATSEETIESILQKLSGLESEAGSLPVVSGDDEKSVAGMIRQKDVVDAYWRVRRKLADAAE